MLIENKCHSNFENKWCKDYHVFRKTETSITVWTETALNIFQVRTWDHLTLFWTETALNILLTSSSYHNFCCCGFSLPYQRMAITVKEN